MAIEGVKPCSSCNTILSLSEFHWANKERTRLRGDCRDCCATKRLKRLQDPVVSERYKLNHRYAIIKNKYGLTRLAADSLLEAQGFKCAVCLDQVDIRSNFDHCHMTGKVRGVLCWHCNTALGKLKDDPVILERAARYLRGESD